MPKQEGDRQALFVYLDPEHKHRLARRVEQAAKRVKVRKVTQAEYVRAALLVAEEHTEEIIRRLGGS